MVYEYNYHNSGHYPSSCVLFKTQLNSVSLSIPHRKHIMSPLRAEQLNAIYSFVMVVCEFNYQNSRHYPSSTQRFGDRIQSLKSPVLNKRQNDGCPKF
jgi:hypothetical protein